MKSHSGQAMVMTIVVVTGALLGATTVAGHLMLRQIRQSFYGLQSTRAIFASETGIEWGLYGFFQDPGYPRPTLAQGVNFNFSTSSDSEGNLILKSVGNSKSIYRALSLKLATGP